MPQPPWQEERPSPAVNFAAGTLASVAATLATQPADVVRTHIQLGLSKPLPPGTRPLGGLRAVQNLVKAQGPGVLLAGALPRVSMCQVVPVCWACPALWLSGRGAGADCAAWHFPASARSRPSHPAGLVSWDDMAPGCGSRSALYGTLHLHRSLRASPFEFVYTHNAALHLLSGCNLTQS